MMDGLTARAGMLAAAGGLFILGTLLAWEPARAVCGLTGGIAVPAALLTLAFPRWFELDVSAAFGIALATTFAYWTLAYFFLLEAGFGRGRFAAVVVSAILLAFSLGMCLWARRANSGGRQL